jgi:tetratricopeptide (TPR) repeat protein
MANFLLKAGICSMETINRAAHNPVYHTVRCVLVLSLITFSCVTFASAAKSKAKPNRANQTKPETMPISANYPASRSLYEGAMVNLENLRIDEAVKNLREAVECDPQFALAHAWLFFSTNDPVEESTERSRAKGLVTRVTPAERLMIQWMVGVHEDNYLGGISAMNDLLAQYPHDKRLEYLTGRWVMAQRQYEYSQKLMLRALAVDPKYPAALNELGYTYARLGDYEKALPAMEKYAAVLPNEPNPQDSYAEIMRMAGYFQGALLHYREALKIEPKFYQAQVGVADTYTLMGDQESARAEFKKAIEAATSNSIKVDYMLRSALTYVREKRFEDADKAYADAAAKAHTDGLIAWEARAHRMMAMYQPEVATALTHLDEAQAVLSTKSTLAQSTIDQEKARILRVRVERNSAENKIDAASKALAKLEAVSKSNSDPTVQRSYHAAAGALLIAQQKYTEAVSHLEEDSYDPLSMKLLIVAYQHTGALDDAKAMKKRLSGWNNPTIEQALVVPDFRIQEKSEVVAHR